VIGVGYIRQDVGLAVARPLVWIPIRTLSGV